MIGAPRPPPVDAKPKKRKREGEKDVDAVKDHEQRNAASRRNKNSNGSHAHEDDPALRDQPAGEISVLVRDPRICSHVGKYSRTTEITRICGDEEKSALEGKNKPQCWRFDRRIADGVLKNGAKRYGIESLTFDRLNVPEMD